MSSFDETYDGDNRPSHDGDSYSGYEFEAPPPPVEDVVPPFLDDEDIAVPHSSEGYGFSSSPNTDYAPQLLDGSVAELDGGYKGYDVGVDEDGIFSAADGGPLLPDPTEMREEGAAFREWRRQNAFHLEEKEKKEKELRIQLLNEAEEFKRAFYEKRNLNCEATKKLNREREKLFLTNQGKFHKEADKQYWKAIAEIIPREVANIEKKGRKKDEEKKPGGITIVQGPKPGKPTNMSRMRQLVAKLKQKPPPHMLPKEVKDAKNGIDEKDTETKKDDKDANKKDAKKDETKEKPVSPAKDENDESKDNGAQPAPESDSTAANEGAKVVERETATPVA